MIELRQLRHFVTVAEELSFSRAADKLHMSQPPLSVSVRNLEEQVGTLLIDRSRHHVRLTAAGQVFLEDARRVLLQVPAAAERARRAAQGLEGQLGLSFVPSAALDLLPAIFKRFQRDYPTVHLQVTAETTRRQIENLRRGTVDLSLVVGPLQDATDLAMVDLQQQRFVVAVPRGHALAAQKSVRIKALAAEPFIAFTAAEGQASWRPCSGLARPPASCRGWCRRPRRCRQCSPWWQAGWASRWCLRRCACWR